MARFSVKYMRENEDNSFVKKILYSSYINGEQYLLFLILNFFYLINKDNYYSPSIMIFIILI